MEKQKRRYFPAEFNRQAAEGVETSGLTLMDVAADWVSTRPSCVAGYGSLAGRGWRPTTQAQRPSPADLAAENARLKRELQKAQTERDILKKAALIFGTATR